MWWRWQSAHLGQSGSFLWTIRASIIFALQSEARLEVYVGDPCCSERFTGATIAAPHGSPTVVVGAWARSVVKQGPKGEQVGAEVPVDSPTQVSITLPAEFIGQLLENIEATTGVKDWSGDITSISGTTEIAALWNLAGRASWVAGLVPCCGAMLELVWALLTECHPMGVRALRCRVALACSWMVKVLRRRAGALQEVYQADVYFSEPVFVITVDASLGALVDSWSTREDRWGGSPIASNLTTSTNLASRLDLTFFSKRCSKP